ncbi:MAG: glycosyltransferase family 4 protein [Blastocatellia bacterium]|nr:glycosyltransferase family 4 protein [Blastocatellia bacterium]
MRILVITDRYPPYYTGGYEIACQSVAERMRRHGHEIMVLTSNYGLNGTRVEGHIHRLLHRPQDSSSLVALARLEVHDSRTIKRLAKMWKPDVIYAWSLFHLFPSTHVTLRELNVPIVYNIQDLWLTKHLTEAERHQAAWLKQGANPVREVAKKAIRTAFKLRHPNWLRPISTTDIDLSNVVFCSRFRHKQHAETGLPLGKSRVIYNGIDPALYRVAPVAADTLKVIFAGRLVEEKGAHTVIEAIAELVGRGLQDITLNIAGISAYPWEYSEGLHRLVEEKGLKEHVKFLGMVQSQDMPEVYSRHNVLVFPSIVEEGFPVTLLEAMACGLTVVGTETGGSAEIVVNGVNGLSFSPGNAAALADCLALLSDNPEMARALASAGQMLVREKFDIDAITGETLEYLRTVAAG